MTQLNSTTQWCRIGLVCVIWDMAHVPYDFSLPLCLIKTSNLIRFILLYCPSLWINTWYKATGIRRLFKDTSLRHAPQVLPHSLASWWWREAFTSRTQCPHKASLRLSVPVLVFSYVTAAVKCCSLSSVTSLSLFNVTEETETDTGHVSCKNISNQTINLSIDTPRHLHFYVTSHAKVFDP